MPARGDADCCPALTLQAASPRERVGIPQRFFLGRLTIEITPFHRILCSKAILWAIVLFRSNRDHSAMRHRNLQIYDVRAFWDL